MDAVILKHTIGHDDIETRFGSSEVFNIYALDSILCVDAPQNEPALVIFEVKLEICLPSYQRPPTIRVRTTV
jgi:hypothetical protein